MSEQSQVDLDLGDEEEVVVGEEEAQTGGSWVVSRDG